MITQFKDEYRWLSNFWFFDSPMVRKGGWVFPTNEHFYVAMKTSDLGVRKQVCSHPLKGLKKFGTTFPLRDDWDDIKLGVMLYGLRYKFSKCNPSLRQHLIDTGDQEIQEGNWWGDRFWGICLRTGGGGNNLGRLLMQVREEINMADKL